MIRVKFYYSKQGDFDRRKERITDYNKEDFYHLVQGSVGEENKEPPFRDEDSLKFIKEIDHAEFVGGDDWYSIVTPFGRTDVTALCGGTRFALVILHNSKRGIYTSIGYHPAYGEDIWSRLAEVSTDILVAFDMTKLDQHSPYLPIETDYMIENYPHGEKEITAYIGYDTHQGGYWKDGVYYDDYYFSELHYEWYRDIKGLIAAAERLIEKNGRSYPYCPLISPLKDFVEILNSDEAELFTDEEKNFMIKNYLRYVPQEPIVKYPINLVVTQSPDGKCILEQICSVKFPTYSESLDNSVVELLRKCENLIYVLVLNADTFYEGAYILSHAMWGFRGYGYTLELYDGTRVLEEFLKEIKEPYETGNLYIRYRKWQDGKEVAVTERVDDKDD